MLKRFMVILSTLIIIALITSGLLLYKNNINKTVNKLDNITEASTANDLKTSPIGTESTKIPAVQIVKSEEMQVQDSTAEYDLKASIYQNSLNETFLKLEYYLDGTGVVKEIGEDKLPELKDLFNNRADAANPIGSAFLNSKKAKVYLIIERKNESGDSNIFLYDFNLEDSSIKKIFDGVGKNSVLKFNNNFDYLAFNLTASGGEPQDNFLQIVNCDSDDLIIKNSLDSKGALIGDKKESGVKIDYSFLSWNSDTSVNLNEIKYLIDKSGKAASIKEQDQIVYDIAKNSFLNADDSDAQDSKMPVISTGSASQVKLDSQAVKTLKNYYECMSTEQYEKANDFLDDKFKLNLKIFKQFGIDEITKLDMDVNNMSLYGSLFKTAKIKSIVSEKPTPNDSTIYFYLSYSMGESDEIVQPLVATLIKSGDVWKILSVSDGDENDSPFKK